MGRTANSVTVIHRSVPPRPFSYTFTDVLRTSLLQTGAAPALKKASRSKTAPASSITPEEYAERFKSRPTTRPAVIDLDCGGVRMYAGSGAVCRFNKPGFPAVKTTRLMGATGGGGGGGGSSNAGYNSNKTTTAAFETVPTQPLTERGTSYTPGLHLAPLGRPAEADPDLNSLCHIHPRKVNNLAPRTHTPDLPSTRHPGGLRSSASSLISRGKSPGGSQYPSHGGDPQGRSASSSQPLTTSGASDSHWQELSSSKLSTLDALTFSAGAQGEQGGFAHALTHSDDYGDLSELPKPKRILPRRDLPWVFRFKVKKELNALSKIMASKPSGASDLAPVGPTA